jgi:hypothetical protein
MTILIRTLNSDYEIRYDHNDQGEVIGGEIRFVGGIGGPTECFAPVGEWKPYRFLSTLSIGSRLQVGWKPDAAHPFTLTSPIKEIKEA